MACAQARTGPAGALKEGRRRAGAVGRREGRQADARWGRGAASASPGAGDSRPTHSRVRVPAKCPR